MKLKKAIRHIAALETELWNAIHDSYVDALSETGTDMTFGDRQHLIDAAYAMRNARLALEQIK